MCTIAGCRRFTSVFNCLIVSLFILMISRPAMGQDISITDFRIPTSSYQRFLGGLSGGWDKSNQYDSPDIHSQSSFSGQSSNLRMFLSHSLGNFNEDHSLELFSSLDGRGGYSYSEGNWMFPSDTGSSKHSQSNYQLSFDFTIRYSKYLVPDRWHVYIEGSGSGDFVQMRDIDDQIGTSSLLHDSSFYRESPWSASINAGIGYGKMRDGSSIFAILRILDKLREDSLLSRPLSKDETLKLVEILARRNEYSRLHDRYIKFLMADLFGELQKMNALRDGLPRAYSVERAVEVLSERIEPRLFGWRARLGIQRTFDERTYASEASNSSGYISSYYWNARDYFHLAFDYAYPVSINFQFNSELAVTMPGIDYKRKTNFDLTAKGIYQVGERIDAALFGLLHRNHYVNVVVGDDFDRIIDFDAGIQFRFFIENQVTFNVNCIYSKAESTSFNPNYQSHTSREGPSINFGVNYRFV